jgi:NAD(P)-dependent dehydrogenase (short-subunit alcohol dehydrogenase family)
LSGNKAFLVAGGSGAIGAAVCEQLAAQGYMPLVGYHRSAAPAHAVAARCGGMAIHLDLASEVSISNAITQLEEMPVKVVGTVLAGAPSPVLAPFGRISADDLHQQWLVGVRGPQQLLAGLVRRFFRKDRQGSVIGILSQAMGDGDGGGAASGMGAYVIGKYGLAGVLALLAADYPWLRVRSVKPGYTETPMLNVFDDRFLELQRTKQVFLTPAQVAAQIVTEAI